MVPAARGVEPLELCRPGDAPACCRIFFQGIHRLSSSTNRPGCAENTLVDCRVLHSRWRGTACFQGRLLGSFPRAKGSDPTDRDRSKNDALVQIAKSLVDDRSVDSADSAAGDVRQNNGGDSVRSMAGGRMLAAHVDSAGRGFRHDRQRFIESGQQSRNDGSHRHISADGPLSCRVLGIRGLYWDRLLVDQWQQ